MGRGTDIDYGRVLPEFDIFLQAPLAPAVKERVTARQIFKKVRVAGGAL